MNENAAPVDHHEPTCDGTQCFEMGCPWPGERSATSTERAGSGDDVTWRLRAEKDSGYRG